jgi:hypothetical protein
LIGLPFSGLTNVADADATCTIKAAPVADPLCNGRTREVSLADVDLVWPPDDDTCADCGCADCGCADDEHGCADDEHGSSSLRDRFAGTFSAVVDAEELDEMTTGSATPSITASSLCASCR